MYSRCRTFVNIYYFFSLYFNTFLFNSLGVVISGGSRIQDHFNADHLQEIFASNETTLTNNLRLILTVYTVSHRCFILHGILSFATDFITAPKLNNRHAEFALHVSQ